VKMRAYIRLARAVNNKGYRVDAQLTPNPKALTSGSGFNEHELHTIRFAVDFDVPRELFNPKDWPTVEVKVDAALPERLAVTAVDPSVEATA
jgi:hypothetical protein